MKAEEIELFLELLVFRDVGDKAFQDLPAVGVSPHGAPLFPDPSLLPALGADAVFQLKGRSLAQGLLHLAVHARRVLGMDQLSVFPGITGYELLWCVFQELLASAAYELHGPIRLIGAPVGQAGKVGEQGLHGALAFSKRLLLAVLFRYVPEDEDHSRDVSLIVAYGGGGVRDLVLPSLPVDERRVVGQLLAPAGGDHRVHGIVAHISGLGVHQLEHLEEILAPRPLQIPAGELRGRGVHAGDPAVLVGDDDPVADGLKGGAQILLVGAQRGLPLPDCLPHVGEVLPQGPQLGAAPHARDSILGVLVRGIVTVLQCVELVRKAAQGMDHHASQPAVKQEGGSAKEGHEGGQGKADDPQGVGEEGEGLSLHTHLPVPESDVCGADEVNRSLPLLEAGNRFPFLQLGQRLDLFQIDLPMDQGHVGMGQEVARGVGHKGGSAFHLVGQLLQGALQAPKIQLCQEHAIA